ncbi:hypothetical protein DL546_000334 [Coniochaeta pulveracea]|uniref:Uncharacterized protein n=1 Tax=Coniochaeta pulveracea TaxID=177199 RepID=A0A420XWU6_9PEZI|nr:hypothetical protein DL546_000334 [Coniochaeta pulveracea]
MPKARHEYRLSNMLATSVKLAVPRSEAEAKAAWLAWWPEMTALFALADVRDQVLYGPRTVIWPLDIDWRKLRLDRWGEKLALAQSMLVASIAPEWRRLPVWREQDLYSSPRRIWLFLESAFKHYDEFAKGQGIAAAAKSEVEDGSSEDAEDFGKIHPPCNSPEDSSSSDEEGDARLGA